ncbi:MAG: hypothetical protein IEMM0006_1354 [bacterium]|nr:MAG: hypothetical protein IEMM0006_1354 [bacterium]
MRIRILFFVLFLFSGGVSLAQNRLPVLTNYNQIVTGDEQTSVYFPLLRGKRVAVVANQSSIIGKTHLVDSLLSSGIRVVRIFSPEHGFRGNKGAGEKVKNGLDAQTGLPVISLYGKHKKPTREDLRDVDVVLFDLQDVGVRFYTYISTMTLVMEASAENHIPLIILDRPNPNGFYVDGPVLKPGFTSFVGMHPVPVVYGMTLGEYARMVNGEHWLKNGLTSDLTVIPLKHYTHNMIVKLPVKPSPNLPNWKAVYLYPSLCFFEGTIVSVGRGTDKPFQIYGYPGMKGNYVFTPRSTPGASLHPKLENKTSRGEDLTAFAENYRKNPPQLHLQWLLKAYHALPGKYTFFNNYFDKLAGTDQLRKQIEAGFTEKQIRQSWQKDLKRFRKIRKKYLLYR